MPSQPPSVDAVGGEVNATMLIARIRKGKRRGAGASSFVLDVSIEVPPGITILFGASGRRQIHTPGLRRGLARPHEGQITLAAMSSSISAARVNVHPKRRIAYVFQTLALFPHLSVEQNSPMD